MATQVVAGAPVTALAAGSASVLAPSERDIERARVLDENARQLYDEGAYEGAIVAWKKAYELTEYNNLLYNISMAYDRAGDFEKALEYLDRYRALAAPEERAQLARRKKSLEARLQKQKETQEAEAAKAEADASGDAAEAGSDPGAGALEADPAPAPAKPPPLFTPAAWALTGVGALGFGLGIGFGAASLAATRRAEGGCTEAGGDTYCSTGVKTDIAKARRNAIVADVSLGVGAVCTIVVVALVAVQARKRKAARNEARGMALAPTILRGGAGLGLGLAARF